MSLLNKKITFFKKKYPKPLDSMCDLEINYSYIENMIKS